MQLPGTKGERMLLGTDNFKDCDQARLFEESRDVVKPARSKGREKVSLTFVAVSRKRPPR